MIFAAAGLGSAWRGGIPRSLIGGAAAVSGLIALQAAIGFFDPPTDVQAGWSPEPANGGVAIGAAFASVIVFELASIAARSWSEARGTRDRGEWTAIGCVATSFAILLGLALIVYVLTIATGGCRC